jgi:hypothetical protein
MIMSLHRAPRFALALAFPVALLACGNSGSESSPASTSTAEAVKAPIATVAPTAAATAAPSAEHGRERSRGRRGGIAGMMLRAARDLDLKDAQKATVSHLAEQAHGAGEPSPSEAKDYHAALAAQVRAGKIDTAKLDVLQAAVDKGTAAHKAKEAEVLDGLHAALDPAQRKALVAAVRAKQAERTAKEAGRHAEIAKLTDADRAKRRLDHLTKQLGLDAAQQKAVAAALAKAPATPEDAARDEMTKHTDAILTAFEADAFDAKKVDAAPAGAKKGPMAERAQLFAVLVPLLKPEQRETLAASLEKPGGGRHGEAEGSDEAPAEQAPGAP